MAPGWPGASVDIDDELAQLGTNGYRPLRQAPGRSGLTDLGG